MSASTPIAALSPTELITHFHTALQEEAQVTNSASSAPNTTLPLFNGVVRGTVHNKTYYRFTSPTSIPEALLNAQGLLTIDATTWDATIIQIFSHHTIIAVRGTLPDALPAATFTSSSHQLLKQLDNRLELMTQQPKQFSLDLAFNTFQPQAPILPLQTPRTGAPPETFNHDQRQAFLRSQQEAILFIWGPPGTGKTTLIEAIIRNVLHNNGRILLCSNTNAAVDQALNTLIDQIPQEQLSQLLRLGTPWDHADPRIQQLTLQAALDQSGEPLHHTIDRLKDDIATLEAIASSRQAPTPHFEALTHQASALHTVQTHLTHAQHRQATVEEELRRRTTELQNTQQRKRIAPLWASLTRQREVANTRQAQLATLHTHIRHLQTEYQMATEEVQTCQQQLATLHAQQHTLSQQGDLPAHSFTPDLLKLSDRQVSKRLQQAYAELEELYTELADLEAELIDEAQCLATTLARASSQGLFETQRFDCVIVDEASMATPPALFAALALSTAQVILVGDPLQLTPIAHGRSATIRQWLGHSVYDLAQLTTADHPRCTTLTTQYRMHPDIAQLAVPLYHHRAVYYHTAPTVRADRATTTALPPFPNHAIAGIDTQHSHPSVTRNQQGSPSNWMHALITIKVVSQFIEHANLRDPLTVAILSPYRAQVLLYQRLLSLTKFETPLTVGTIHQIQGQQADIVILDTTLAGPFTGSLLLKRQHTTSGDNLLNVAITRAKSKLIVIGHGAHLSALPHDTFLRQCWTTIGHHGVIHDSTTLIDTPRGIETPATLDQEETLFRHFLHKVTTPAPTLMKAV